jgi:hypothetical protein
MTPAAIRRGSPVRGPSVETLEYRRRAGRTDCPAEGRRVVDLFPIPSESPGFTGLARDLACGPAGKTATIPHATASSRPQSLSSEKLEYWSPKSVSALLAEALPPPRGRPFKDPAPESPQPRHDPS